MGSPGEELCRVSVAVQLRCPTCRGHTGVVPASGAPGRPGSVSSGQIFNSAHRFLALSALFILVLCPLFKDKGKEEEK